MDEVSPSDDGRRRLRRAEHESLVGGLTEADRPWIEAALADERRPERRAVALHAWIDGWYRRGRVATELDTIRTNLKEDMPLIRILERRTAPPEPDEKREEEEREYECWKRDQACREAQRLEDWKKWRNELLADPDDAFSAGRRQGTVSTLYRWLEATEQVRDHFNQWDKDALTQAFGRDIADRAETAFRALWRATSPVLWSARPVDEKGSIRCDWIHGLAGVSAEASTPGWTASLSSSEARTAAAYATIEIGGVAPFVTDLAKSHSVEVEEVIGSEVSAELDVGGDHPHLSTLQNLAHSDSDLKRIFVPRLLAELKSWPTDFTTDTEPRWDEPSRQCATNSERSH